MNKMTRQDGKSLDMVNENMSEVNLFRIKGDTVQDLEDGQNRERPVMISHQHLL